jgi:hypothetical protein
VRSSHRQDDLESGHVLRLETRRLSRHAHLEITGGPFLRNHHGGDASLFRLIASQIGSEAGHLPTEKASCRTSTPNCPEPCCAHKRPAREPNQVRRDASFANSTVDTGVPGEHAAEKNAKRHIYVSAVEPARLATPIHDRRRRETLHSPYASHYTGFDVAKKTTRRSSRMLALCSIFVTRGDAAIEPRAERTRQRGDQRLVVDMSTFAEPFSPRFRREKI